MGHLVRPGAAPLTALLDGLLGHPPDRVAIWTGTGGAKGGATYGSLQARSAAVAVRLLDGRPSLDGAWVALLAPPGEAFVAALLGIWRAGGGVVPLSALHTGPELEHILTTAGVQATIVDPAVADRLDAAPGGVNGGDMPLGRRLDLTGLVAARAGVLGATPSATGRRDADAALMLFTSGTTGKPKGVELSHAGVAATLSALAEAWRWRDDDRLLHALPLYHTHGLIVALLGAVWAGASVRFAAFDPVAIWDGLTEASVFMAVPTMYVRLMDAFGAAPTDVQRRWADAAGRLRLFTSGSAALPADVLGSFAAATGQTILERYGMTEIGMALGNPYDGPRVAGSVGMPLPGVHVDIVGEDGHPAGDGQPGELRVRSPQLFLGYVGDASATASSFDEAGRFRTGDTGVRDAAGYVRLLGRTSVDILKSGGYKLSALEIEEALRGHPGVADVAVIGVPDPVWGDCVTACVVPRAGHPTLTLDDLRAFARRGLAPYKLPRALRIMAALPRNPMGKVQKSLLK